MSVRGCHGNLNRSLASGDCRWLWYGLGEKWDGWNYEQQESPEAIDSRAPEDSLRSSSEVTLTAFA